jgi:polysaccharide deacetylase 2 family uncharacterized protein YibQ
VVLTRRRPQSPKPSAAKPAASQKSAPQRAPVEDVNTAARIATTYNSVIRRAGGDGAWLKRAAELAGGESEPRAEGEALALAPAEQAIIRAMEQQAAHDGLRVQVQRTDPPKGGDALTLEVSTSQGNRVVCAWRLKQVARLYRAAIVIDDLGQDLKPAHELLKIPYPLTFSILPNLPASRGTAAAANGAGREVMLHLPMQPLAAEVNPGEGAIRVGMRSPEVGRLIETDLASVPYVAGVNNHMGSRATSDPALMAVVMKELASRRLYFIDSRTTASTVALDAAREAGIPAFYRSVFLDDTESVGYTLGQLQRLRAAVKEHGEALAIGHPHPTTITALNEFLPEFERDDIELVPASRLAGAPEAARLAAAPGAQQRKRRLIAGLRGN